MIDIIKKVIDDKVKNLHPKVENDIIKEVSKSGLKSKYKILQLIRSILELPAVGSDKRIYWEKRGWSEEEIEEKRVKKKMPSSPMIVDNWLDKINENTGKKYTKEEAEYKIKSFRKVNIEYWLEKGFNKIESFNKVKEFQKENSEKFFKKALKNPEKYIGRTETQLQYWLNKGYNLEESKKILSKRQNTTSLKFFIDKYGDEEGLIRYNKRLSQLSYTSSKKYYIDKYGYEHGVSKYNKILQKRSIGYNKSSKEAYYFFIPIYKYIRKNGISLSDIYWGVGISNEWFINTSDYLFFYDFTIKPLNIIIEYHGCAFHPKEGELEWSSFYGDNYESKFKLDMIKKKVAENNGFKYLSVFSDDILKEKQFEIIEYIKKRINR